MSTSDALTDTELASRFEAFAIPHRDFGHREHLRLAFAILVETGDFGDAAVRYRRALRAFAIHANAPGKYHETLTWAYLALVHARMYELYQERGITQLDDRAARQSITSFDLLTRFPDLLDHRSGALAQYYDVNAVTTSPAARAVFVLPARESP